MREKKKRHLNDVFDGLLEKPKEGEHRTVNKWGSKKRADLSRKCAEQSDLTGHWEKILK